MPEIQFHNLVGPCDEFVERFTASLSDLATDNRLCGAVFFLMDEGITKAIAVVNTGIAVFQMFPILTVSSDTSLHDLETVALQLHAFAKQTEQIVKAVVDPEETYQLAVEVFGIFLLTEEFLKSASNELTRFDSLPHFVTFPNLPKILDGLGNSVNSDLLHALYPFFALQAPNETHALIPRYSLEPGAFDWESHEVPNVATPDSIEEQSDQDVVLTESLPIDRQDQEVDSPIPRSSIPGVISRPEDSATSASMEESSGQTSPQVQQPQSSNPESENLKARIFTLFTTKQRLDIIQRTLKWSGLSFVLGTAAYLASLSFGILPSQSSATTTTASSDPTTPLILETTSTPQTQTLPATEQEQLIAQTEQLLKSLDDNEALQRGILTPKLFDSLQNEYALAMRSLWTPGKHPVISSRQAVLSADRTIAQVALSLAYADNSAHSLQVTWLKAGEGWSIDDWQVATVPPLPGTNPEMEFPGPKLKCRRDNSLPPPENGLLTYWDLPPFTNQGKLSEATFRGMYVTLIRGITDTNASKAYFSNTFNQYLAKSAATLSALQPSKQAIIRFGPSLWKGRPVFWFVINPFPGPAQVQNFISGIAAFKVESGQVVIDWLEVACKV